MPVLRNNFRKNCGEGQNDRGNARRIGRRWVAREKRRGVKGGKIVKADLADLWGEMKEEKDPTIAKYKGFYQSMVPKLKETPIIMVDETTMTPKDALKHLEQDSDMGKKIRKLIEKEGAIALVK